MRKMKYSLIKKRILGEMEAKGNKPLEIRYSRIRHLFGRLLLVERKHKSWIAKRTERQMLQDALPILRRIYYDPDTPQIIIQKTGDTFKFRDKTADFLDFIEKIVKRE